MMKTDLGADFLRSDDLLVDGKWRQVEVTIANAHNPGTISGADKKLIDKPVLEFEGKSKKFVVGKINQRLIAHETGAKSSSELIGKTITIYPVVLDRCFGQENVTSIRVRISEGRPRPFLNRQHVGKDITNQEFV